MMTKSKTAFFYSLFAVTSIVANLLAQDITLKLYHLQYQIPLSVMVGTAVGLLIKYVLDKKYIFRFSAVSLTHDSSLFVMYSAMGLVTTLIFWGFEFIFDYLYHTKYMRYVGAIIGLGIGYFVKYNLDKRFVFSQTEQNL